MLEHGIACAAADGRRIVAFKKAETEFNDLEKIVKTETTIVNTEVIKFVNALLPEMVATCPFQLWEVDTSYAPPICRFSQQFAETYFTTAFEAEYKAEFKVQFLAAEIQIAKQALSKKAAQSYQSFRKKVLGTIVTSEILGRNSKETFYKSFINKWTVAINAVNSSIQTNGHPYYGLDLAEFNKLWCPVDGKACNAARNMYTTGRLQVFGKDPDASDNCSKGVSMVCSDISPVTFGTKAEPLPDYVEAIVEARVQERLRIIEARITGQGQEQKADKVF